MTLLENFYYGNLIPNLLIPPDDTKLWKAVSETEQKLREHLSEEDQERFIQYSNQLGSVNAVTVKESFLIGFRYGMLMMMEVLRDSSDILD